MARTEQTTVTHIAGMTLTVCGRVIQRCSLCGEKLCDSKNAMMMLDPNGQMPRFPTFETGRLVQVTEGNPTRFEVLADSAVLPEDTCLDLVED